LAAFEAICQIERRTAVNENVPVEQAVARHEHPLPPRVQEALGELVGVAQEGLLALSVGVGLGVLAELMEEEVTEVVGPKGRHDPDRSAVRHGHQPGEVTLGGRRVGVERPRVRAADGSQELGLSVYQHFADRDPLSRIVLERMLAGVSCRRYGRTQERLGLEVEAEARGVSKSSISRTFIERTRHALGELMARRLDDVRLAVLMLDGIDLKGRTCVVALGITSEGVKIPLGLWEGSTENATVATALLADLIERGLDTSQGVLCVIDGSKALRKAIRDVLGCHAPVQRCIRHKERNVLAHLPERDRALVRRRLRAAWADTDYDRALGRLEQLAAELAHTHPGAASSLREGMAETLTLSRLRITGSLTRTLASTNPIESMIECVRRTARNVKHWSSGEMALRWTAAGMLEAEAQFRKIIGYRQLAKLAVAIERDLALSTTPKEVATLVPA
jgi:putative transposase